MMFIKLRTYCLNTAVETPVVELIGLALIRWSQFFHLSLSLVDFELHK